jgi:hypothetical protein
MLLSQEDYNVSNGWKATSEVIETKYSAFYRESASPPPENAVAVDTAKGSTDGDSLKALGKYLPFLHADAIDILKSLPDGAALSVGGTQSSSIYCCVCARPAVESSHACLYLFSDYTDLVRTLVKADVERTLQTLRDSIATDEEASSLDEFAWDTATDLPEAMVAYVQDKVSQRVLEVRNRSSQNGMKERRAGAGNGWGCTRKGYGLSFTFAHALLNHRRCRRAFWRLMGTTKRQKKAVVWLQIQAPPPKRMTPLL